MDLDAEEFLEPGTCRLCGARVEKGDSVEEGIALYVEHLRVNHPEAYEHLEKWPDGKPVIVDQSLEAEDFE